MGEFGVAIMVFRDRHGVAAAPLIDPATIGVNRGVRLFQQPRRDGLRRRANVG